MLWRCRAADAGGTRIRRGSGLSGYQEMLIVDVDDGIEAINAYKAMDTLECSGVLRCY